jgi:predicted PurR-regulated permease PerM
MLATLFLVAFVVVLLYVGREIFIPIAIAILVSFVLSPPILLLRRWGLGRVISVLTVVFAALVIAFSVSAVLTRQVSELAIDLPLYQATINAKLDDLRGAAANNALFAKVSAALKNFAEINPHRPAPSSAPAPLDQPKNQLTRGQESERPIPVEVHQPEPGPFAIAQTIAGTALSPLETTFIVVIFVVFILLQREDLRNRFIRLVGSSDLQRTTLAMNDAGGRLSRFFFGSDACERFLRRYHCRWPLFHRPSEPDPLGHRRILAAVRPLHRLFHRRWFSGGPGGSARPGLGYSTRNLGLVSYCRTDHRAGS